MEGSSIQGLGYCSDHLAKASSFKSPGKGIKVALPSIMMWKGPQLVRSCYGTLSGQRLSGTLDTTYLGELEIKSEPLV